MQNFKEIVQLPPQNSIHPCLVMPVQNEDGGGARKLPLAALAAWLGQAGLSDINLAKNAFRLVGVAANCKGYADVEWFFNTTHYNNPNSTIHFPEQVFFNAEFWDGEEWAQKEYRAEFLDVWFYAPTEALLICFGEYWRYLQLGHQATGPLAILVNGSWQGGGEFKEKYGYQKVDLQIEAGGGGGLDNLNVQEITLSAPIETYHINEEASIVKIKTSASGNFDNKKLTTDAAFTKMFVIVYDAMPGANINSLRVFANREASGQGLTVNINAQQSALIVQSGTRLSYQQMNAT
jgi:hypothetical protein